MPRTFVLTAAVCVWGFVAAVALADKGDAAQAQKAQAERAVLLQQIAELKAMLAKLQEVAAQRNAFQESENLRAVEAWKRAVAEKALHKGPHPEHRQAMERLENIRAAVKHLNAAGLKEIAAAVAKQGDQIQAELAKHHKPGRQAPGLFQREFKKGEFQGPFQGGPKGGRPGFFKGGPPPGFKGGQPFFKGGPPAIFKGPQPPFKGDKSPRPADGALKHHLNEMSAAIGRLSKQVEQLQKAVGELQKRK